jgi:DNA-binding NtrC family response regulator
MGKNENDQIKEKEWILPPALLGEARYFEVFFNNLFNSSSKIKNPPIIIYAPRGSGKTLFTNIFFKLYKEKYPDIKDKVRVNVAAFPRDLIESELFGYKPGAFTGASRKGKPGLIENAQDGVLILEEIGELPKHVQAKLLVFVEDGLYYKVGGTKPEPAKNIQIVCTTNRNPHETENGERLFRKDFLDRFHFYFLSPIHKRRADILYYIYQKFPDVIERLTPYQVMTLLTYNWPGNVREIERVAQSIRLNLNIPWARPMHIGPGFSFGDSVMTSINQWSAFLLRQGLKQFGKPIQRFEKELRKYGLSLSFTKKFIPAFKKQVKPVKLEKESDRFGAKCYQIEAFKKAYDGFRDFYCPLFRQNEHEDKNLADVKQWDEFAYLPTSIEEKHKDLADEVLRFLQRANTAPKYPLQIPSREKNILAMPFHELKRYYFKRLLDLNNGKIKSVANQANLPESTCRDQLKRLGLTRPKTAKAL